MDDAEKVTDQLPEDEETLSPEELEDVSGGMEYLRERAIRLGYPDPGPRPPRGGYPPIPSD
ncbi:MAG: hypothetical protein WCP28_14885 [Actinomycetes bacterium]